MSSTSTVLIIAFAALFGAAFPMAGANVALLDAIRANDGDRVRTLLAKGADPNSKDSNQASALMYAALYARP